MQFTSPILAAPILAVVALPLLIWIAWLTRRPMRVIARWCSRAAALMLWLALAGLQLRCDRPAVIAVMVDVSPSTRGALLRDPKAVAARVAPLLAGRAATVRYFADGLQDGDAESRIERTRLKAPDADAVLLLSDGRLEASASLPPVFAVVDPSLDAPGDGRVVAVTAGESASVSVAVDGEPRRLSISGANPGSVDGVAGNRLIALRDVGGTIHATLNGGDRWPENNAITAANAGKVVDEQWVVGWDVPGMQSIAAKMIPMVLKEGINTSAVVLPVDRGVTAGGAAALRRYVESFGGTLFLVGSPAMHIPAVRDIAPLSGIPPRPTGQWVVLLDASGSMAEGGRWPAALSAAERAVATLAPTDAVTVMTFNRQPHVVADHQTPAVATQAIRDLDATSPSGPTGLLPALQAVAGSPSAMTQVLLVTDGDADVSPAVAGPLMAQLTAKNIRIFALLTNLAPAVQKLAERSGGEATVQSVPANWAEALDRLAGSAQLSEIHASDNRPVQGRDELAAMSLTYERRWKAWAKESTTVLAADDNGPLAAVWQVGLGRVVSFAADLPPGEMAQIVARMRRPSSDPRFAVTFDEESRIARLTAMDNGQPMNALQIELHVGDAVKPFTQTAPGVYETPLAVSGEPNVAVITMSGRIVARQAIAGRYAHEFDVIGNDRAALQTLAERTGGRVIEVGDNQPIDLPKSYRLVSLQMPAAIGGVILSLLALLFLRLPYWEDRAARLIPWRHGAA